MGIKHYLAIANLINLFVLNVEIATIFGSKLAKFLASICTISRLFQAIFSVFYSMQNNQIFNKFVPEVSFSQKWVYHTNSTTSKIYHTKYPFYHYFSMGITVENLLSCNLRVIRAWYVQAVTTLLLKNNFCLSFILRLFVYTFVKLFSWLTQSITVWSLHQ